ncbi:hypothetical protein GH714_020818 [Hevea brasiliensis]|uniref:RING-type domain-containing protein n=1 Tax=Hevea brasiliensis TaxID=3981 RepID=A0A6A6MJM7_HEVBR|nr:hypothetical protein GH714_020818 [Hevea brasiliensis]
MELEIPLTEKEGKVSTITSLDSDILNSATAVKRAVTTTGVRVSIEMKQEGSQEPEASALKPETRVKEEPDLGFEGKESLKDDMSLDVAEGKEIIGAEKPKELEIRVKEEAGKEITVEEPDTYKQEGKSESKLPLFPEHCEFNEGKSDGFKVNGVVKEVKEQPKDLRITFKEESDVCEGEVKSESNQPRVFQKNIRGMTFKEYCEITERKSNGCTQNVRVKEEPDIVVMEKPTELFDSYSRRQKPMNVTREMVEDTRINGINVEDGISQKRQIAEFTPGELNSRKRSLNLEGEEEAAAMLSLTKRRKVCQQYPEQNKDEQAISESSLNKLVGAADIYNLEEMEPPSSLICKLKPYQKQALYWMSEAERGLDAEKAAKTLHPCWAAYRICDERASSIYLNIFSGEATTQFPTATQMARGGILADAMGLGKTVMTIALILARTGKGSTESQESTSNKKEKTWPKAKGGTLVVCPMALLGQWKDELETHAETESISIFVHYGGDRTKDSRVISGYDVVLTTYGVLTASYKSDLENSIFHRVEWYRVVLDEAHTIKSWKTIAAQAAFALSSHCRWCLTGTPLQNNLEDLYSLLCFLHVEPWCNWAWWNKLIQRPYENGDPRGLKLIKAILRPLMLRRTKDTKDKAGRPILVLPPTDIQIIECEHSEAEHDFYDALFRRSKVQFDQFVAQGKVLHNYASILELLLRLRQCCNHPFLVMSRADSQQYADLSKLTRRFLETNANSAPPGQTGPTRAYIEEVVKGIRQGENTECPICMEYADDPVLTPCAHRMCRECILSSWRAPTTGLCPICRTLLKKTELITCPTEDKFRVDVEKNWKESSKVSKLLECLERIRRSSSGEKSIVFSQWTSFLDLLEIPLRRRRIGFLRFDGKLVQKQRERVLKEFNETEEKTVLLMSLKAGGVGLNLTAASNVFLMDPWWNPAVEEQAIMRIHRIGQKRTVTVRRFIVKNLKTVGISDLEAFIGQLRAEMVAEAWILKMGNQVSSNLKHALLLEPYKKKNPKRSDTKERETIGILSFEVANVMSKTVHLHKSLTDSEVYKLKAEILKSEGVHNLVSTDENYLLQLALAEKLDDLSRIASVVSRLGKKCTEPALQGFEHVYGDIVSGVIDVKQLGFLVKDTERMVRKMERYVNATSNLYAEMEVLNELEQATKKFQQNQHEESRRAFEQKLIWQKQDVRHLKEISLWNQTYDKVVELLARKVCTIYARICVVFGESVLRRRALGLMERLVLRLL